MSNDINKIFADAKRLHFVGIGGSGMFPIVQILLSRGYAITGSDVNESSIVRSERELGIEVTIPHCAAAVEGADVVVATAALLPGNPEIERAQQLGIPIFPRAEVLGYVSSGYNNAICVSGTHGKTTTTSMLTQILLGAGADPAAVIGGKLPAIGGYGRSGGSDVIAVEACEYVDTFLHLHPTHAIILNIDRDHLDYFGTVERLIKSFSDFGNLASKYVIANGDDTNTLAALKTIDTPTVLFGEGDECDYRITNVCRRERAFYDFELHYAGGSLNISLFAPGRHNIFNAAAAATAALLYGCTPQQVCDGIAAFRGAGRRFEILGKVGDVTIADDYAHHPEEIRVTLTAAKQMGYNNIWAVFQPFTFSRTKMLMHEFAEALDIADRVVLTEIMGSREVNTLNVHSSDLAKLIDGSVLCKTFADTADFVRKNARPGDLVITLGCGDIYKAAHMMLGE